MNVLIDRETNEGRVIQKVNKRSNCCSESGEKMKRIFDRQTYKHR